MLDEEVRELSDREDEDEIEKELEEPSSAARRRRRPARDASPSTGPPPPGRDPGRPGPGPRQIAERMRERRGQRRTCSVEQWRAVADRDHAGLEPCEGPPHAKQPCKRVQSQPIALTHETVRRRPERLGTHEQTSLGHPERASRQPRRVTTARSSTPSTAMPGSSSARGISLGTRNRAAIAAASRWCRSRSVATPTTGLSHGAPSRARASRPDRRRDSRR